jgi:hypothetical protein
VHRLLALTVVLALFALAAPLAADEHEVPDEELLEPCANVPAGVERVTLDGLTTGIDNPAVPLWGVTLIAVDDVATTRTFILDLAGNPVTRNQALVEVTMTWDIPVEDYDLDLLDEFGAEMDHSENVQPLDPAAESVAGTVRHCRRFTAAALNWTAAGVSELVLDITVRS